MGSYMGTPVIHKLGGRQVRRDHLQAPVQEKGVCVSRLSKMIKAGSEEEGENGKQATVPRTTLHPAGFQRLFLQLKGILRMMPYMN